MATKRVKKTAKTAKTAAPKAKAAAPTSRFLVTERFGGRFQTEIVAASATDARLEAARQRGDGSQGSDYTATLVEP